MPAAAPAGCIWWLIRRTRERGPVAAVAIDVMADRAITGQTLSATDLDVSRG
jgi:hypothetical protein